ncbi:C_GCAxxG_C_C family protein [Candidatus Bathyarchaeota archaeon]|nr:C_GCAxxG_C_C family protein [Candidatus Bathyarchaeota archaeon]MBS7630420.1 C_GCAxxG_C_C family protein [Candidatus Bathyarchaeota archaeon]
MNKIIVNDAKMKLSKEEAKRSAATHAEEGFLCSESVLMALAECLGVSSNLIPRMATGFGAGIGRRGEICGALSGAIMGVGLRFGRNQHIVHPNGKRPYWYASQLIDLFVETFGDSKCNNLIGLDLSRTEDLKKYREYNVWNTKCRNFIEIATEIAYDVISSSTKEA